MTALNVGVTGHRVLPTPKEVESALERALGLVEERFPGRPLRLFSSLAEGADRIAARQVLSRPSASLVAVLPMPRQRYLHDFASASSRDEFSQLVEAAGEVVELPFHDDRRACYEQAGRYLLNHCELLLAVWDGLPPRGAGGTGDIVAGAAARGLPVLWVQADPGVPGGAMVSWL